MTNRPVTASLRVRSFFKLSNRTRTNTSLPASRPEIACRAVKSVVSNACGPVRRRTFLNRSSYDHSISIRAGRSLRLQTTTEPFPGSANVKPWSAHAFEINAGRKRAEAAHSNVNAGQ